MAKTPPEVRTYTDTDILDFLEKAVHFAVSYDDAEVQVMDIGTSQREPHVTLRETLEAGMASVGVPSTLRLQPKRSIADKIKAELEAADIGG